MKNIIKSISRRIRSLLMKVRRIGRSTLERRESEILSNSNGMRRPHQGATYTGNGMVLGRQNLDLINWGSMLTKIRSMRNVVMGGVGTLPTRLALVAKELMEKQHIEAVNLGVSWVASFTHEDVEEPVAIARASEKWEEMSTGVEPTYVTRKAVPTTLVAEFVATPSSDGGLESQPERAIRLMREDPLLVENLDAFADDVVAAVRRQEARSCSLVTWESGGGTDPCNQYVRKILECDLTVNRQYRVKVRPSRRESLARRNFRGSLAMHAAQETPDDTVFLLTENATVGSNRTDEALVAGLLTYTSTEPQHQEMDAASRFRTQRETGDFIYMRSRVIPVTLNWVAMKVEKEMLEYQVERPPTLDGDALSDIIRGVSEPVLEDNKADHFVVISGIFAPEGIDRIRSSIERLQIKGSVDIVFNRTFPSIYENSRHEEFLARYLIVDYIYGERAYWYAARMLEPEGGLPDNVTRDKLREIGLAVPELETALRIDETLEHYLQVRKVPTW